MNAKKKAILQTALKLFYAKGIHQIGINEVIAEAGIAKRTLYHHFSGKEQLVVEALTLRDEIFLDWLASLFDSTQTGQVAIIELFYGLHRWFNNQASALGDFRGCFFINASAEYRDHSSPIYNACKLHKHNVLEAINKQVSRFQHDEQKALSLTHVISTLKEGCITSALVQHDLDAALKVIPTVKVLISDHNFTSAPR